MCLSVPCYSIQHNFQIMVVGSIRGGGDEGAIKVSREIILQARTSQKTTNNKEINPLALNYAAGTWQEKKTDNLIIYYFCLLISLLHICNFQRFLESS